MKLSIVVPVYKESTFLNRFLHDVQRQELQDFEIILVIDTNSEDNLNVVNNYKDFFKNRLGLIFNTKRMGRTKAIYEGVKKAQGKYILISSVTDIILKETIKELTNLIVTKETDIIEFIPRMRSPIRFKGYLRKAYPKKVFLKNDPTPIAYTFPFDFNKIFVRQVLLKSLEEEDFNQIVNTRFVISYVLKTFYFSETYSNVNKKIVRSKLNHINELSPLIIAKQWEDFRHYILNKQKNLYLQEFDYLSYFHEVVILSSFASVLGRKSSIEKYNKYLNKQIEQYFAPIMDKNKYFLLENEETIALREAKNFHEYSKILKSLN